MGRPTPLSSVHRQIWRLVAQGVEVPHSTKGMPGSEADHVHADLVDDHRQFEAGAGRSTSPSGLWCANCQRGFAPPDEPCRASGLARARFVS